MPGSLAAAPSIWVCQCVVHLERVSVLFVCVVHLERVSVLFKV